MIQFSRPSGEVKKPLWPVAYTLFAGDLASTGRGDLVQAAGLVGSLPAGALSMYRFTELPKPKIFKDGYRELLDNAPLTEEQRQALIDETVEGFRINASLFAQLGCLS